MEKEKEKEKSVSATSSAASTPSKPASEKQVLPPFLLLLFPSNGFDSFSRKGGPRTRQRRKK